MSVHIGISGWTYAPWRGGTFYPAGLAQRKELAYVAGRMNSVEINGSFYALQRPSSYRNWAASVPEDFTFAVKGGRFITHLKKLTEVEIPLANFFASGVLALGPQLGPVLWQLPPQLGFDVGRMRAFFDLLPATHGAAAHLAEHHDAKVPADRALTETTHPHLRIRYAVEVRHDSFRSPEFVELLRAHHIAMVLADNPGTWPILDEMTTDLKYVRLHGHEQLYASGYTAGELDRWASKIRGWVEQDHDVYVYCDNDAKVRAPYDAMGLMSRLGLDAPGAERDR